MRWAGYTGWAVVAVSLALAGCSSNGSDNDDDGDSGQDAGPDADVGGDPDGGDADASPDGDSVTDSGGDAAPDGDAPTDRSCAAILGCANACRDDRGCVDTCAESICEGGAGDFRTVMTCLDNRCTEQCADLGSEPCQECAFAQCRLQLYACTTGSCVPGEISCAAASLCVGACHGGEDCEATCQGAVCPNATDVLDELLSCAAESCPDQCEDFGANECAGCVGGSCREQSEGCLTTMCTGSGG